LREKRREVFLNQLGLIVFIVENQRIFAENITVFFREYNSLFQRTFAENITVFFREYLQRIIPVFFREYNSLFQRIFAENNTSLFQRI